MSGGFKRKQILKDVERYDTLQDKWESLPSLNTARFEHSSCILGKTLYVIGGLGGVGSLFLPTKLFEKLDNIVVPTQCVFSRWQQIETC